jgi:multisubunit Na+/H+ antiporter MnhF subunit
MNAWQIAAVVLAVALIPCLAVALFSDAQNGLVALELAAILVTTILVLIAEGTHRQPFIDLAVVLAPMSLVGSLMFARLMER